MDREMRIKVGYQNYQVVWHTDGDCGNCDRSMGTIWVSNELPLEQQAVTLLHEVMHAIWDERAMRERETEERVVDGLSRGLATVMIDNPELFEWIIEALNGDD